MYSSHIWLQFTMYGQFIFKDNVRCYYYYFFTNNQFFWEGKKSQLINYNKSFTTFRLTRILFNILTFPLPKIINNCFCFFSIQTYLIVDEVAYMYKCRY